MKKVMINAYTRFNLGDDLFIKILCERYPNTQFLLYAPQDYKSLFKSFDNISIFPSDQFIYKAMNYPLKKTKYNGFIRKFVANKCDAEVQIGGSLFIQGESWKDTIRNNEFLRMKNKPYYLLGANFGPYNDPAFYQSYKEVFKEYTDICFREKYSYDLFQDLDNVRLADDIVFQLKKKEVKMEEKNIAISVIKPSFRKDLAGYDDAYYKLIKDISIQFIQNGYKVNLLSFCEFEADDEAIEEITNLIPNEYLHNVNKHFYKLNLEETLNIIAKSHFVVATRFHAMILGWVYNKPVFPIVYSKKMTNVMEDAGFNGYFTDFKNIGAVNVERVFEGLETNKIDVSGQVERAERHFEKLDKYLLS